MQRKVFLPRIATELLDSLEDLIDVLGSVGAVGEERELVEEESAGGDPDVGAGDSIEARKRRHSGWGTRWRRVCQSRVLSWACGDLTPGESSRGGRGAKL